MSLMHGANVKMVEEAVEAVELFTQTVYLLLDFVFPFTLCEINALHFFMILFWVHDRLRKSANTTVSFIFSCWASWSTENTTEIGYDIDKCCCRGTRRCHNRRNIRGTGNTSG